MTEPGAPSERERAVMERMVRLLSGRIPLVDCESVLAPDVIKHMDDYISVGLSGWKRWFYFLQEKGRVSELSGTCDRMEKNPDGTITLFGRWEGVENGKPVATEDLSVRYRVEGDRIVELWTSRENYVFFFGGIMRYRVGLWLIYAYMLGWYYLSGRDSLAARLAEERLQQTAG